MSMFSTLLGGGSGGMGGKYVPLQILAGLYDAYTTAQGQQTSRAENAELLASLLGGANAMGDSSQAFLPGTQVERWNADKGDWEYTTLPGPRNPLAAFEENTKNWERDLKAAQDLSLNTYKDFQGQTNRAYEDRATRNMGEVDAFARRMQGQQDAKGTEIRRLMQGLGDQAKKDLNTAYDANAGSIRQDAVSRGLAGTTVLPSMLTGNTRERADSMGRLNEGLRREQVGVSDKLWSEQQNLSSQLGTNRMNMAMGLQDDALNTRTALAEGFMNRRDSNTDRLLNLQRELQSARQGYIDAGANTAMNVLGGVNVAYPDLASMNQRMGASGYGISADQQAAALEIAAKRRTLSNMWGLGGGGGALVGAGAGAGVAGLAGLATLLPGGLPAMTAAGIGMAAGVGGAAGGGLGYLWGSQPSR